MSCIVEFLWDFLSFSTKQLELFFRLHSESGPNPIHAICETPTGDQAVLEAEEPQESDLLIYSTLIRLLLLRLMKSPSVSVPCSPLPQKHLIRALSFTLHHHTLCTSCHVELVAAPYSHSESAVDFNDVITQIWCGLIILWKVCFFFLDNVALKCTSVLLTVCLFSALWISLLWIYI